MIPRKLLATFVVTGLLLLGVTNLGAQTRDSSGTDFWLTFPSNLGVTFATLSLFITGNANTTGTVAIPGLGFSTAFTVTAGQVTTVNIPVGAELETSDVVEYKGIHVTAMANVTVYGLSSDRVPGFFSSDAYLGLPTAILGTDYLVLGYQTEFVGGGSQFDIVATADGTMVMITPTVTEGMHTAGVPYAVALNQGQTYQLTDGLAGNDLTGTIITSNKPIAVFGGNQCADVPSTNFGFCNLLVEELPPTSAWGKNFFTVPLATRMGGDTFRFLASANNTHVSVNATVVATLNRGQFFQQLIGTVSQITSDQPILVAQYSNSGQFDSVSGASGDPFMMLVPPAGQYLARYTVTTPLVNQFNVNFVNITAQTSGVGTIQLDGTPISAVPMSVINPIGTSGFSGAQVPLSVGSHNLTGSVPFGVILYGFFPADGYGTVGGFSLSPIALVTTVTLAPKVSTASTGSQSCLGATVTDQNGVPLAGVRVDFTVTGVNPMTGFANTGTNGQAQFCYTGTVVGADTVMAAVGTISDTATVNWFSPVTVALAPKVSTTLTGTQSCLGATVADQNGMPLAGVRVNFTVTGVNPTTGFAITATNGQAAFCYTGANSGTDTVRGAVGTISDTATVNWTPPGPGFTLTPMPPSSGGSGTTVTLVGGDTGVFTVMLTPTAALVGRTVTLTCPASGSSLPPNTICELNGMRNSVTITATSTAPITITVKLRTNCVAQLVRPRAPWKGPLPFERMPMPLAGLWTAALLMVAMLHRSRSFGMPRRWAVRVFPFCGALVLLLLVATQTACVSNPAPAIPGAPQTPAGTYTLTVGATGPSGPAPPLMLIVRVI